MTKYKFVGKISITISMILISTYALGKDYPPGSIVHFKTVTTPADIQFARTYLRKYFEAEKPVAWVRAIREGEISIARTDLDDDGIQEVFIMLGTAMWCGSRGCQGLLLQNRRGKWELIDRPTISEEATIVMPEKQFGYHKLYTGEDIYTFRNGKDIPDLKYTKWHYYPVNTPLGFCGQTDQTPSGGRSTLVMYVPPQTTLSKNACVNARMLLTAHIIDIDDDI